MLALLGEGIDPAVVAGLGLEFMLGRHRTWLHLGTSRVRQGQVLCLSTFPQTWHPLSLQTWERLGWATRASLLKEQALWVRCLSACN